MDNPAYIDPKDVKMKYERDDIDKILERRSSFDRVEERRNQLINSIHSAVMQNATKHNTVFVSEFKEYEMLFVQDTKTRAANGEMDETEYSHYEKLSTKFQQRFNNREEIVILDDYTKEELYRLPPEYTPLNLNAVQQNPQMLDIVQNTSIQHATISSVITEQKHGMAVYTLARTINDTQNLSTIQQKNQRYHELVRKLKNPNEAVTSVNTNVSVTSSESEDDLLDSLFD